MANAATPIPSHTEAVAFSTRHLRKDLLDGMRVAATLLGTNLEDTLNQALAAGLPVVRGEAEVRWMGKAKGKRRPHPVSLAGDLDE